MSVLMPDTPPVPPAQPGPLAWLQGLPRWAQVIFQGGAVVVVFLILLILVGQQVEQARSTRDADRVREERTLLHFQEELRTERTMFREEQRAARAADEVRYRDWQTKTDERVRQMTASLDRSVTAMEKAVAAMEAATRRVPPEKTPDK